MRSSCRSPEPYFTRAITVFARLLLLPFHHLLLWILLFLLSPWQVPGCDLHYTVLYYDIEFPDDDEYDPDVDYYSDMEEAQQLVDELGTRDASLYELVLQRKVRRRLLRFA